MKKTLKLGILQLSTDTLNSTSLKNFAPANYTNQTEVFDMSITSDAVRIVKELVDEILGMVHLGRVQEMMDDRMTTGKSEVMEEH